MAFNADFAYEIVFTNRTLQVSQAAISRLTGLNRGSINYQCNKEAQRKRVATYLSQPDKRVRRYQSNALAKSKRMSNPEYRARVNDNFRRWYEDNPDKYAGILSRNRKRAEAASQDITTKREYDQVKAIYLLALNLTKATGIRYVIDHIQPLCAGGEHAAYNLQVIPYEQNASKSGKWGVEEQRYFCNGLFF